MSAQRSQVKPHSLAYVGLAALFLVSITCWTRNSLDRVDEIRHGTTYARDPFDFGDFADAIRLQPEAEAAGVREGDVVVSVGGDPLEGYSDYYAAVRRARTGDRLHLGLRASGASAAVRNVSIPLQPLESSGLAMNRLATLIFVLLFLVVMPLFCIALGFWVAAVRIGDGAAWLLLALMLTISMIIGASSRTLFGRTDSLQPLLTAYVIFFNNLAPTALVFFAIAFPDRLAFDRKHPWVKWVVFAPLLLRVAAAGVVVALMMHHLAFVHRFWNLYLPLDRLTFLHVVALLGFFVILGYKTVTTSNRDARRRLLLLVTAGAASFVPPAILFVLVIVRGVRIEGWTGAPLLMMLIFPLTMAYVIVVHRVMDVRVVIRQSLQYVLTRGGVRVAQVVLSALIIIAAASMSADAGASLIARAALMATGLGAVLFIGRFAERLRGWVDRRFFREAYEADAILSDLASKVRTMVETGPLLETVATRVAESLHVPRIAILLDGGGTFQPAYALGYPARPNVAIQRDSLTVKQLREQQHALVEFDDADSWVQLTGAAERTSLEQLQSELLLPLSLNEKLLGIMTLGAKQSEEPFSRSDIRLLDSVAAQTGLALENGRLTAAIAAEVAARAKEKRDLEIARDVQERLFPQDYPPIAGLEYAGACRPALGVGGDYYDFILLPNAQLGIAIGDVSGKGIPAALLMATLRAYLRGAQTIHHQADLTEVMRNLNKLVYESSAANRYATFFYAEFDPSSRVLNYVNGGHNPPMLFRQANGGRDVLRLDTGGAVIGLMEDCVYTQGRVTLEPGDVLVAYTDGVSEAMNVADDEWGEEALMEAVRAGRTIAAGRLIERIMEAADAFVAGAPQHDDMTIVVVRDL